MTTPKKTAAKKTAAKKAPTRKSAASATRGAAPKTGRGSSTARSAKAASKKAAAPRRRGAAASARDMQVLELRRAGVRLDVIATQLKFRDVEAAHAAYERALDATLPPTIDEARRLELDRLDRLQTTLWPKALRGDLAAINQLGKIAEERLRLISTDPLPSVGPRERGPIEAAVAIEVDRLEKAAPALAAAALELARQCDETKGEPGLLASAARELRMTMSQLRGLASNVHPDGGGKKPDPDDGEDKPKKGGVVIEQSRLEQLRELMYATR